MKQDPDIDDIVVERLLAGDRLESTADEKREALRIWLSWGKSEADLCRMHGWREGRYKDPKSKAVRTLWSSEEDSTLILEYALGSTYRQIANTTGRTFGSVKSRIQTLKKAGKL